MAEKIIHLKGEMSSRRVWLDSKELSPERSLKLRNHSPTGFCWGYGGSGPAQLALAVLLDITDEETALSNYQDFKRDVIAGLNDNFDVKFDISKYIRICRVCGCTEKNTCPDDGSGRPCQWVEQNLCSTCVGVEE